MFVKGKGVKKYFSLAFVLIVLVSVLLGGQVLKRNELLTPLGTSTSFELYLGDAGVSRDQVIQDLEQIAAANKAILLKPNTDSKSYGSVRNLYYFSPSPPSGGFPSVGPGGKLEWFTDSMTGDLLPASALGDAPISGTYHVSHSAQAQQALERWAADKGLTLRYRQPESTLAQLHILATQTGLGISFVAVLLLSLALVVTDVLNRTYLRSIQLLNGVDTAKINLQQISRVLRWGGLGVTIGLALSLLYATLFLPAAVAANVALSASPYLGAGLAAMVAATVSSVLIFAPNVDLIRTRSLPTKLYRRVNLTLQVVAVAVCVMASGSAAALGKNVFIAYQQQVSTKAMGQSVAVSFKTFDYLDTQEGISRVEQILAQPEIDRSAALSMNIGAGIELTMQELGGYDQIDIANQSFLDLIKLPQKALLPVKWESLPDPTAKFLNSQLELWIPQGGDVRQAFRLYTLSENSGYISLDPNVGQGGQVNRPAHPLIIVPTMPIAKMDTSGFSIPAISSSNLIFTDPVVLRDKIYSSPIAPSVRSIDRIADAGLVSAQYFKGQAISYLSAIIVSFILIAVTAWQSAMIWAAGHRKHILVATMSGVAAKTLYRQTLNKALSLTLVAATAGALTSVLTSGYVDAITAMFTAMVMMGAFWSLSAQAYASNTRLTFKKTIRRKA
ncbi:hypothetical protein ACUH9O_07640 [Dermabacteraceae bacterium P13103]